MISSPRITRDTDVLIVETGKDQTFDNVLVDTGSGFLWLGHDKQHYIPGAHSYE